jgi:hypothetical protein
LPTYRKPFRLYHNKNQLATVNIMFLKNLIILEIVCLKKPQTSSAKEIIITKIFATIATAAVMMIGVIIVMLVEVPHEKLKKLLKKIIVINDDFMLYLYFYCRI